MVQRRFDEFIAVVESSALSRVVKTGRELARSHVGGGKGVAHHMRQVVEVDVGGGEVGDGSWYRRHR